MSEQAGARHITLDRTNLKRLAAVMSQQADELAADPDIPAAFALGWKAAVDALTGMSDLMPDLYGDDGCPVFTRPE